MAPLPTSQSRRPRADRRRIAAALATIAALAACGPARERAPRADSAAAPGAATAATVLDSTVEQDSAGWAAFHDSLPREPTAAAAALERYRAAHGLPFDFFVDPHAPARLTRALRWNQDDMCGETVSAFVQRIPVAHRVLVASPALEIDSAGRTLRRWALSDDVEFWEVVVGVHDDTLITEYRDGPEGVYLRTRPDGEYHVSAAPPDAPRPEGFVRCPDSPDVEGMLCNDFRDGARRRRLAFPTPCT